MLFRGGVAVTEGLINLSRLPRGEVSFRGAPSGAGRAGRVSDPRHRDRRDPRDL